MSKLNCMCYNGPINNKETLIRISTGSASIYAKRLNDQVLINGRNIYSVYIKSSACDIAAQVKTLATIIVRTELLFMLKYIISHDPAAERI